jgi:hypothetical protein
MRSACSTRGGEVECIYRVLVKKREGRIPLGRHRRGWEDIIKMDLRAIRCSGMDLIKLALMNTVMNLRVP